MTSELHRILVNSAKEPKIIFKDVFLKTLVDEVNKYKLSTVGEIIAKFRKEMAFLSPSKEDAIKFLDGCLFDPRLDSIRKSLEDYIDGKIDIIMDV